MHTPLGFEVEEVLEQAREEARLLAARGLTVYVYRMGDGYWLEQLPPRHVKREIIEKVETE